MTRPKAMTDQERLQGEWGLVGLEVREEFVPAAKLAGTALLIRGDKYATRDTTGRRDEAPGHRAATNARTGRC